MTKRAATLMVQGTASSVGKSLVVAGLCRHFRRRGLHVAPFKAQNMSLNAAVTPDGFEIGRAQAVQAQAAKLAARVEMNPILLKPESETGAQLVLMGRPAGHVTARDYAKDQAPLKEAIANALVTLRAEHELVVIEGAGSPAEINLKARDLVNMHVAKLADAKVILVGDIDRGGVFASLLGTLALLDEDERARVGATLINKFRGDVSLLEPGLVELAARSAKPVLGVLPYLRGLQIADEDSVELEARMRRARPSPSSGVLDVAVLRLPHLSNYDDVLTLEHEPDVLVRFVDSAEALSGADLVIVPGTKSTLADLAWLRVQGLADALLARARDGAPILGVCGGCQMLGERIDDPHGVESSVASAPGLGLLPLHTEFTRDKRTTQVRARLHAACFLGEPSAHEVRGYEIHMGRTRVHDAARAAFSITRTSAGHDVSVDGAIGEGGHVVGTMLHGLFDDEPLRFSLLDRLRARRGLAAHPRSTHARQDAFDRLADAIEAHLDLKLLWQLAGLGAP